MKTAVLIHGYHLDSRMALPSAEGGPRERSMSWHDLVIGPDSSRYITGRATYGIRLAWLERADAVIFSTGASEKDGMKEAEYTYATARLFLGFVAESVGVDEHDLRQWLQARVRLDITSQTTAQELARNLAWCAENGHGRVFLVTNRFHAPRALANANAIRNRLGLDRLRVYASSPDDRSDEPVIFEPPTRPDRDATDFRGVLERIFRLAPERRAAALADIDAAIAKHL